VPLFKEAQAGSQKKLIFEFWLKSISINVQEAVNFNEDLAHGLRQRLGSFGPEQIDFNIKYKGVQFLNLDIQKVGGLFLRTNQSESISFATMRQISLNHFEKINLSKPVLQSYNCELDNFFDEVTIHRSIFIDSIEKEANISP
jgi:hypothetical protein